MHWRAADRHETEYNSDQLRPLMVYLNYSEDNNYQLEWWDVGERESTVLFSNPNLKPTLEMASHLCWL